MEKGSSTSDSDSGSRTKRYSNNNKSIPMIRLTKLKLDSLHLETVFSYEKFVR